MYIYSKIYFHLKKLTSLLQPHTYKYIVESRFECVVTFTFYNDVAAAAAAALK